MLVTQRALGAGGVDCLCWVRVACFCRQVDVAQTSQGTGLAGVVGIELSDPFGVGHCPLSTVWRFSASAG